MSSFTVDRVLNAPRETVYRAWTEPEHLTWFFNPGHPTDVPTTVDLRVGGQWRQGQHAEYDCFAQHAGARDPGSMLRCQFLRGNHIKIELFG